MTQRETPRRERYRFDLSCGHHVLFPTPYPNKGDKVWCAKGNHEARVLTEYTEQLRTKCQDCKVGNTHGEDLTEARRSASKHSMKYRHTVVIRRGDEVAETIGPKGDSLPFDTVLAERQAQSRAGAQALRNITTVTKS